jgi:adenylate cyclase
MLEALKTVLTTNYKASVPQMILLCFLFMVFIGNAVGLLQFRDNFIPDVSFSMEYFRDANGNLIFPRIVESGEFIYLLLSGVALAVLLPVLPPIYASVLAFSMALPPFVTALNVPSSYKDLPMQFNLLVILTLFGINVLIKYFAETREKQKLLDVFSQFVPPEIVNSLNYESKQEALLGEARYLTVFFCDLRNFTSMSEQLDPREVVKLLNEYFNTMTSILYRYGATIDKYVGDSVMAFWGAPARIDNHAERAVKASFEMHRKMESLAAVFHDLNLPTPTIGIGINTGMVNVGNMGSNYRLAYTVIGDAVNLAFRLQGITRQYQVPTIVGEETMKRYPGMVYRELDTVAVKGKSAQTRIYQPLCLTSEMTEPLEQSLALHKRGLEAWYRQDWQEAAEVFGRLLELDPADTYYASMLLKISEQQRDIRSFLDLE